MVFTQNYYFFFSRKFLWNKKEKGTCLSTRGHYACILLQL
uniref:Uncharacterized protein n=1 Tax=Anguilla anguilla TaxID=7936 RepID=A0A0E9VRU0_ANGAN